MNIHYYVSDYISHRRAGEAYIACLRQLGHTLVADPGDSDLVVIHEGPHFYGDILKTMPRDPGRKFVGYGVWETPQLPQPFIKGAALVDAIWTCSEFSRQAFLPYAKTFLLPHVVERAKASREDMAWAMERIGIPQGRREDRDIFYFYTIVDTVNPRKDVAAMLTAFAAAFPRKEDKVRLVVKQYRAPQNLDAFPLVVDIPEPLSDGQIAALHAVCDAYVSTHHAEAWGLPLSEALSFGNPVIATAYSGNMEFMTAANSFPVPYTLVPVPESMCRALPELFRRDMTWADIDGAALVQTLRKVRSRPVPQDFRARAAASMSAFSPAAIRERLAGLLEEIFQ
ncbi:Glycosyl transferase group 1 [uncultured delta proteobacterium]|uniref:Glycosyl transferase group 1 n=1 Tax=uncultured delta proteobacterium TaxID=34034 RepID=A0A212ITD3_9DELT|nr:Glycosyl transferase group 1 [uncultured delta proteobacterium]